MKRPFLAILAATVGGGLAFGIGLWIVIRMLIGDPTTTLLETLLVSCVATFFVVVILGIPSAYILEADCSYSLATTSTGGALLGMFTHTFLWFTIFYPREDQADLSQRILVHMSIGFFIASILGGVFAGVLWWMVSRPTSQNCREPWAGSWGDCRILCASLRALFPIAFTAINLAHVVVNSKLAFGEQAFTGPTEYATLLALVVNFVPALFLFTLLVTASHRPRLLTFACLLTILLFGMSQYGAAMRVVLCAGDAMGRVVTPADFFRAFMWWPPICASIGATVGFSFSRLIAILQSTGQPRRGETPCNDSDSPNSPEAHESRTNG
jgi:hypothetical protein